MLKFSKLLLEMIILLDVFIVAFVSGHSVLNPDRNLLMFPFPISEIVNCLVRFDLQYMYDCPSNMKLLSTLIISLLSKLVFADTNVILL